MDIPTNSYKASSRLRPRTKLEDDQSDEEEFVSRRINRLGISPGTSKEDQKVAVLWALLASYLPEDVKSIEKFFVHHVEYTLARGRGNLTPFGASRALALSIRDRLIERWKDTQLYFKEKRCKRVAYLSLEFLLGRSLQNSIVNLGLEDNFSQAMKNLGYVLEDLYEEEQDAGLGNGGLGRLAACFLDSMATMDYPAWGYGLRYKYGMFYQVIKDGKQIEFPDYWLAHGNPWEVERMDVVYPVSFYGKLHDIEGPKGTKKVVWEPQEKVLAVAYDTPIPGYDTYNTLNIRLWSAQPSKEFDLQFFNKGDFFKSIEDKQSAEQITSVLYPNDNTPSGKELRLKQQYFLVSATMQDIVRRFTETKRPIHEFPSQVAIQLNDTHPTLGVVELMRLLIDDMGCQWKEAWELVNRVFAYTNHTVLPEALEKWSVDLMGNLLPRHMRLIYDINFYFLQEVEKRWPGDVDKLRKLSIIEEGSPRMVRMANLAIIASHSVNGVAAIHSQILKDEVFPDFAELFPNKFLNITNGVTPRRWVQQANPELSLVLTAWLRTNQWITNLDLLSRLKPFADNPNLQQQWAFVKMHNKEKLAKYIEENCGIKIPIDALYDVQVKRIHEYKRQLLNILYVIYRYKSLKAMDRSQHANIVPRVIFFGGKAAPGYFMAKLIIELIIAVSEVINKDRDIGDLLKVVFIPNYCVSLAELIIPASELSQHISTAGTEASGTSNMKFAMNGCLIIGTLDGANIEIRDEIGKDNMFIFGARAAEIEDYRKQMRAGDLPVDPRFEKVLKSIENGDFGAAQRFAPIIDSLRHGNDHYLLAVDFPSYIEAQLNVDRVYKNRNDWLRRSILSTAGSGKFSSDRTIQEYAKKIWNIEPCRRPGPVSVSVERLGTLGVVSQDAIGSLSTSPSNAISLERMTPSDRLSMTPTGSPRMVNRDFQY